MNEPALEHLTVIDGTNTLSRRRFLNSVACGSLLAMGSPKIVQAAFSGFTAHKTLSLEHHHTGDTLKLTYYEHGRYIHDALKEASYFLRDYHNDAVHTVDTALLDQLYDVKLLLRVNKPFHIVSAYRSPGTNASLRRHSRGVARHSLHMQGRAVDIRMEGVSAKTIRDAAHTLQRGGVGYYPNSNFVHLDTGEIRTWHR
ncbi:YcbK family protein [Methyloglobulus sp.]|uniref:YcbK family protein n=1 Tax=Methyloglobulus sp. TaxID=2518622 RepID=UPI00398A0125